MDHIERFAPVARRRGYTAGSYARCKGFYRWSLLMDLVVSDRHCCLYRKSRAAKVSLEQRKDKESATAQPFFPSVRLSLTFGTQGPAAAQGVSGRPGAQPEECLRICDFSPLPQSILGPTAFLSGLMTLSLPPTGPCPDPRPPPRPPPDLPVFVSSIFPFSNAFFALQYYS